MNSGFDYREQLGPRAAGRSLLDYLAERYSHSTAPEWATRIAAGQILLDGRLERADTILEAGQHLIWRRPPWEEPPAPTSFAVLFRDDELIAVAKPAGLPTLPGAGFLDSTLLHRVQEHVPEAVALHRLGRWTSGVILFARTRRARAALSRQLAERVVRKDYRALVHGRPARDRFLVETPIGPVPYERLGTVHAASAAGRPAASRVEVLERGPDLSLCRVRISTGRPHQIRIHLAAAGHPLVGDPLYAVGGRPRRGCTAVPGDPGYRLHAERLTFRHPCDARIVAVECAPPPALRTSIA